MRTQTAIKSLKFASALEVIISRVLAFCVRSRSLLQRTRIGMAITLALLLLALQLLNPVIAQAATSTVSRAYQVDGNPTNGNLVSLDSSKSNTGHLANIDNSSDLLGVVVGQDDSLVAIDPGDNKVQVAIGGTVPTLVSTIGGDIKKGDLISVSPLIGLGMKAEAGLPVVGRAQADFTSQTTGATPRHIDKKGQDEQVYVGFISVEIDINNSVDADLALNSLQKLVKHLTGRVIPTIRIILSLIIIAITVITLIMLIYASIFGSIISIGRNPLAKSAIMRTLFSVLAMALLLTVVAGVALMLLLS